MPSPTTTNLPIPKSWDELEDICADILKRLWKDPYAVRNGRSGQRQQGVDIYGQPEHLGGASSGKYAGAQCKHTDTVTVGEIEGEVEKAKAFEPALTEYLIMTTAPRDAVLQRDVRTKDWPFRVSLMFWEDISLELSGNEELLKKHFPGWMQKTTTTEDVLDMVSSSTPEEFDYDDHTGVFVHTGDVKLQIFLERGDESQANFDEPWVREFAGREATQQPVYIHYGETRVKAILCVYVDGGRHIVPLPRSATDLTISRFQYHIGSILNHPVPGSDFELALKRAKIAIREE